MMKISLQREIFFFLFFPTQGFLIFTGLNQMVMNWEQLLSLKKYNDQSERLRIDQDEGRLSFEVDFDRVTFSEAFRGLQDKTQVIPLSKTDFVHTRLTHSMEVSVVGRSLGRAVGKEILKKYPYLSNLGYKFGDFGAIVAAAALAHDIGNPPFGHFGEKAIGAYFDTGSGKRFKEQLTEKQYEDLIHFEGNANGFRLLTQTKHGVKDGLRLTYATLGTFTKYPKESLPVKPTSDIADKKFGFFQSEKHIFADVAESLGLIFNGETDDELRFKRHPLAFLVEAADDICYTLIDFEDGINLGLIEEEYALEYLVKLVADNLRRENYYALTTTKARVSYLRALAINTLIKDVVEIFLKHEEEILRGEFNHALLDKSKYQAQIEDIINISIQNVYRSQQVRDKEIAGYRILETLLDTFTTTIERKMQGLSGHYEELIRESFLPDFEIKASLYENLIGLCSEVASLTDGKALEIYQKIQGLNF